MTIPAGTHQLTEANGDLLLYTTVEGPAAALGHNLILRPAHWRGTVTVGAEPADCQLSVEADVASMAVYGSRGGAKPVSPSDRKVIDVNIGKALGVGSHPTITFVSERIEGTWEKATVTGRLTLRGRSEEQQFDLAMGEDGKVTLTGAITQSRYGVKPFSTMIGAMRLGDDVAIKVAVTL